MYPLLKGPGFPGPFSSFGPGQARNNDGDIDLEKWHRTNTKGSMTRREDAAHWDVDPSHVAAGRSAPRGYPLRALAAIIPSKSRNGPPKNRGDDEWQGRS